MDKEVTQNTASCLRVFVVLVLALAMALTFSVTIAEQAHADTGGVTDVDLDYGTICALKSGGVWCWGENSSGRVGNGWDVDWPVPSRAYGLETGSSAVASGVYNTCAISGGAVDCWGRGAFGMLGRSLEYGEFHDPYPAPMPHLPSGVSKVAVSYQHACALLGSTVKCWGFNREGELGNGSQSETGTATPVTVSGIGGADVVTALEVEGLQSCAVVNGAVKCWGSGNSGINLTPVTLPGLESGVTDLAIGGSSSCAIKSGTVWCWGLDILNNFSNTVLNPVELPALGTGATSISVSYRMACAVFSGAVKCWGGGALGDGSLTDGPSVVSPSELSSGIDDVELGMGVSCARGATLKCWGIKGFTDDWDWDDNLSLTPTTIDFDVDAPSAAIFGSNYVTTTEPMTLGLSSTEDGWFECQLDGVPVECNDTFTRSWTAGYDGEQTLEVVAYDMAGNASDPVQVTIWVNVPYPSEVRPDWRAPMPVIIKSQLVAKLAVRRPTTRRPVRFKVGIQLFTLAGTVPSAQGCSHVVNVHAIAGKIDIHKRIYPSIDNGQCKGSVIVDVPKRARKTKFKLTAGTGGSRYVLAYSTAGTVRTR